MVLRWGCQTRGCYGTPATAAGADGGEAAASGRLRRAGRVGPNVRRLDPRRRGVPLVGGAAHGRRWDRQARGDPRHESDGGGRLAAVIAGAPVHGRGMRRSEGERAGPTDGRRGQRRRLHRWPREPGEEGNTGEGLVVCPRNDLAVARTWPNGSSNGDSGPNRRNASQIKRQLVQGTPLAPGYRNALHRWPREPGEEGNTGEGLAPGYRHRTQGGGSGLGAGAPDLVDVHWPRARSRAS